MKRVTATEARRRWFVLLDEILDGEVVVIDRCGGRVVLRREEPDTVAPDYGDVISARGVEGLDRVSWRWDPESGDLELAEGEDDAPESGL